MKLQITLEQAKILQMALSNEKEVLRKNKYHDTTETYYSWYENRVKRQKEIIILLNKIAKLKNENNEK